MKKKDYKKKKDCGRKIFLQIDIDRFQKENIPKDLYRRASPR